MGITEAQFEELQRNVQMGAAPSQKRAVTRRKPPAPISGPLEQTITLWGHCPSKKNLWQRGTAGKMFLATEVKDQIDVLTTQAVFAWKHGSHVEHPELTVKFFVTAQRQDQDGMYTTVLDCLQSAGVILNDNIAHNNGTKILPPCEFVAENQQRVDITVRVK